MKGLVDRVMGAAALPVWIAVMVWTAYSLRRPAAPRLAVRP